MRVIRRRGGSGGRRTAAAAAVNDSVFGAIQLICWHICRFTLPLQGVVACADAACSRRELHNG